MNHEKAFSKPDLVQVYHAFSETDYGRQLQGQVRFERYKPEGMGNREWQKLLGVDVNNLQHHMLTFNLTKIFVKYADIHHPGILDNHEKAVLEAAAITHDWGETSPLGDITFSDKTLEHIQAERQHFEENLQQFLGEETEDIREIIKTALQEVIFKPESKLGAMFNAVERIGYVRTALQAAQHVEVGAAPAGCENGLKWLVTDVFSNQPVHLIRYSDIFIPVDMYLFNKRFDISSAFDLVNAEIFENYEPDKRKQKQTDFFTSKVAWEYWVKMNANGQYRYVPENN